MKYVKHGFTLIELSVVLVIIGLIVGGVMVGQNLIEASKIRAQINQIEEIETQINTFKLKYNCLPGDCSSATSFFGATYGANTVVDGNDDGIIRSIYSGGVAVTAGDCIQPDVTGEISQLLMQLNAAGFGKYTANGRLSGGSAVVGVEYTAAAYGNGTGLFVSCLTGVTQPTYTPLFFRTGNIIVAGAAKISVARIGYATGVYGLRSYGVYGYRAAATPLEPIGFPADVVRQIDEKIDDGKPNRGKFGIVEGDTSCSSSSTAYPSPSTYCRATAGKRIN